MKWTKKDDFYWFRECGRYYVCRSLAFDKTPAGHWVYLTFFKRLDDQPAECISAERRDTFEQAAADAGAHIKAQRIAA